jgi:hypothetical protein
MEKMGALPQQVVIDEVAEERNVGPTFFHATLRKYYIPDITIC